MSDNIIRFPIQKINSDPPTVEEIKENLLSQKEEQIEEVSEILANMLLEQISTAGFLVTGDEKTVKELCFCMEALKALMCKYYDIEHPFHAFADACFQQVDEDRIAFIAPIFKEKLEIKE
ncbi:hypothetical protein EBU71_17375, partial [bacterium]|nr:hypothetical protein [Candidatus Elulimicrobium humile]